MIPNLCSGQSEIKPPLAANLAGTANQKVPVAGARHLRARANLIASFANGVARDEAAVRAAITSSRPDRLLDLNDPRPVRQNQRARSLEGAFSNVTVRFLNVSRDQVGI
jgi:hypothetical protein